jgi:hypothetical protein
VRHIVANIQDGYLTYFHAIYEPQLCHVLNSLHANIVTIHREIMAQSTRKSKDINSWLIVTLKLLLQDMRRTITHVRELRLNS